MKPIYFFISLIGLLITSYSYSQTGPGGVGNQTNNRLWISVDAVEQVNGSTIQSLPDLSGNGNDVSQSVVSRRPIYTTGALNGFPVATMDGTKFLFNLVNDPNISTQNITIIDVFRLNNENGQTTTSIDFLNGNYIGKFSNTTSAQSGRIASIHRYQTFKSVLSSTISNSYTIHSMTVTPTQMRTLINGNFDGQLNQTYLGIPDHNGYGIGGKNSTTRRLKGEFAEAIIFNTTLTNTQRIIVENYLSSKYNLAIANDFYTAETSGHYYEVFGIGQVGGQPHNVARGSGIVTLFNPTTLSDNEFLLCGHDDAGFDLNDVNVPPSYVPNLGSRFNQTWRVSRTGDLGLVDITFDLTDIAFGNPDNYQLLITSAAAAGDFTNPIVHTTGVSYDLVSSTLTFTGVNFTDGDYFTIGNSDPFIISIQDGNWNDPLTWNCSCIPNSTHFVIIDVNTNVTLDVNTQIESLTINPLGIFNLANASIAMSRSVTVEGQLNPDNGTLEFNGVAAVQNFAGVGQTTSLNNVTINKSSGVVNLSNITTELNGTLSILAGSFDVTAANFIVNSTSATANGNIGPLSLGAIVGNITVRRFVPAGNAGYRDLSSPLMNIPLSQWDDDFSMSGPGFPDGCAMSSSGCYSSVKYYENDTWFDVTAYSHTLVNGRGYYVYLGNNLTSFAGTTIDVTGAVHTGNVVRNTTTGWSLVGNPFASNLDFNSLNRTGSVGNYFYVYDSDIGNYQWYDGASGTAGSLSGGLDDLQSGVIALGQGFWIDGGGSITMSQNAKVSTTTNFLRTSGEETSGFSLIISSNDSPYKCDAAFYFDQNASPYFDASDIRHLKSLNEDAPYIASVSNNQELRLNKFNNEESSLIFPLITNVPNNQIYTINVEDIDNFREYRCVYIIDYKTGEVYDLRSISEFTFEAEEIKSNQARFVLVLTQDECEEKVNQTLATTVNAIQEDQISFIQNGREVQINFDLLADKNVDIEIVNTLGQVVASTNNVEAYKNTVTMNVPSHSKGMHLIRIISTEGQIVKKIVVQ